MTTKKTFYYNFVATSAEEAACRTSNTPFQPTRVLVDIRDVYSPPVIDPQSPWQIEKKLTQYEVATGRLVVPFNDAFEHVFRYWKLSMANHVVLGHKMHVIVWDISEESSPKRYRNDTTFFDLLHGDDYILACPDLVHDRGLCAEDEIGLYWDPRSATFQFKLLQRAV